MHEARWLSLLLVASYLAISFGVGNLYPFSVFDMYAGEHAQSGSRVIVRDARGGFAEIEDYTDYTCADRMSLDLQACQGRPPFYVIPYVNAEKQAYIAEHSGTAAAHGEAIDVVARIWWLDEHGVARIEHCQIAACIARRR